MVHASNKTRRVRLKVVLYYGLWIYELALWSHVFIICREVIIFHISYCLKKLCVIRNEELLLQLHAYSALSNIYSHLTLLSSINYCQRRLQRSNDNNIPSTKSFFFKLSLVTHKKEGTMDRHTYKSLIKQARAK